MDQLDRMTMGWWRPSPGSIYPLLEQLEKEKLVEKQGDGRYQLTKAARSGPEWMHGMGFREGIGPRTAEDGVVSLESYVRYLEDVASAHPEQLSALLPRLKSLSKRLDKLTSS